MRIPRLHKQFDDVITTAQLLDYNVELTTRLMISLKSPDKYIIISYYDRSGIYKISLDSQSGYAYQSKNLNETIAFVVNLL